MGHQDRYRHVFEHEVRSASKDEFADPGMSVGTHHEQIGSEIESPHFESLAGSQACRWKTFRGRRDAMARQGCRQFGTWNSARSLQCLLRVNPGDGDSFRLLKERYGIEGRSGSFPRPVPPDKNLATKRSGSRRIWNEQERTPKTHDEALDEIKLDAEAVASIDLAGDDQICGHAMLDDRVRNKRRLAIHKAPFGS